MLKFNSETNIREIKEADWILIKTKVFNEI